MEVTASPERLRARTNESRARGDVVGFVPTMGALHRGHAKLLEAARAECGFVVASIFVNPLQFGPAEDLAAYPRPVEKDQAVAEAAGCDLLFTPDEAVMYPGGPPEVTVDPGALGDRFEGASRPGHFRGVLTAVAKLFGMVGPSRAYFGEKDAQQVVLVRRMAVDLDQPVTVVSVPTVREADGLALSSRNGYLGPEERLAAPVLFDALSTAAALVRGGERDANALKAEMAKQIGAEPLAKLDYVAVVDDDTWAAVDVVTGPSRALAAARVGPARLIDNLRLPWEPGWSGENRRHASGD